MSSLYASSLRRPPGLRAVTVGSVADVLSENRLRRTVLRVGDIWSRCFRVGLVPCCRGLWLPAKCLAATTMPTHTGKGIPGIDVSNQRASSSFGLDNVVLSLSCRFLSTRTAPSLRHRWFSTGIDDGSLVATRGSHLLVTAPGETAWASCSTTRRTLWPGRVLSSSSCRCQTMCFRSARRELLVSR